MSPDGARVFVPNSESLLQLRADNLLPHGERKGWRVGWTLSPDGSELVCAYHSGIEVWHLTTDEVVRISQGLYTGQVVFAPDGVLLAVGVVPDPRRVGLLTLVCVPEGREIAYFRQNARQGYDAWAGPKFWVFSPDGKKILLAHSTSLAMADVRSGRSCTFDQGGFDLHDPTDLSRSGQIRPYQFSPDGQFVFGVDLDCIRIWHCESGTLVAALPLLPLSVQRYTPVARTSPFVKAVLFCGSDFGIFHKVCLS